MENKIAIKLTNGKEIVTELCNYDGNHPEIVIYIQKNGVAVQDICLVRPYENIEEDIECLVWSDEYDEDYSHRFIISQYQEEE